MTLAIGGLTITILGIPFAIILAGRWSLVIPVVASERRSVFGALKRSRELMRGRWWRTAGVYFVFGVSFWLISAVGWYVIGAVTLGEFSVWPQFDSSEAELFAPPSGVGEYLSLGIGMLWSALSGFDTPGLFATPDAGETSTESGADGDDENAPR
jgi:hypothetical protein